jgi:collagenase-like PrtC family protease
MVDLQALAKNLEKISTIIINDAHMVYIGYFYYYSRRKEIFVMIYLMATTAYMVSSQKILFLLAQFRT